MIIANCGTLQLNWERTSLSTYFETLEASNDAQGGGAKEMSDDKKAMIKRAMAAQG